jgi:hypothetical protein
MNIDEAVDQIRVTSLNMDSHKYIPVIISKVLNPSFFWIRLIENKEIINQLMIQMQ